MTYLAYRYYDNIFFLPRMIQVVHYNNITSIREPEPEHSIFSIRFSNVLIVYYYCFANAEEQEHSGNAISECGIKHSKRKIGRFISFVRLLRFVGFIDFISFFCCIFHADKTNSSC